MQSPSGRYVIAFNGEIYNHFSIRAELDSSGLGPSWVGHSDTLTLLSAIDAWGLVPALRRCTGMWAFSLIDLQQQVLHLVRDRFGEKPLYWGISGSGSERGIIFGSELSSLRSYPSCNNPIDRSSLQTFLQLGHIPDPSTIYTGLFKLHPAHLVTIPLPFDSTEALPTPTAWWNYSDVLHSGHLNTFTSVPEALAELDHTLRLAVSNQSISDVPLGSFLSGGIDSSLVTALLQTQTGTAVRTFTVGFDEQGYNESFYARQVSSYLGTDHTEISLSTNDALDIVTQLPSIYNEPFADSSQIPTYLVCREARNSGLTVALTGDGSDEFFGGYNRHIWAPRLLAFAQYLPSRLRRKLRLLFDSLPPSCFDFLATPVAIPQFADKLHKLSLALENSSSIQQLYLSLLLYLPDASSYLQSSISSGHTLNPFPVPSCIQSDASASMMYWDVRGYLPNDILVKVDRASMSVGLETRAPFLDHTVASIASRLPRSMKIRSGTSKWALRQLLYQYVPRDLIDRPKSGFAVPIGSFLRGSLRNWAEELLNPARLQSEGYLNPAPIQHLWRQHLSGRYDHSKQLWSFLMWQSWLQYWG